MTAFVILLCVVLLIVVAIQIGRISELSTRIRGEEDVQRYSNIFNARLGLWFVVGFIVLSIWSAYYYKNYMLGYGPLQSASEHGPKIQTVFNITLFFTGIVFVLTHIALFWFAYKFQGKKGRKVLFLPHDNRLEVIWTVIPAIVMCGLVVGGLYYWNDVMSDVKEGEDFIEIEATGYQFGWAIRYQGADGALGTKNFRLINPSNNLVGQDWKDKKNLDDFMPDDIVLPVGKKVRVRITSRDVLHNFYLPHFQVKMDAIPGLPTFFVFTPTKTTEQYRQELKKYEEYNTPYDEKDPTNPIKKWEAFNYELACAELCGNGHFSMRKIVKIVSQGEYDKWVASQKSYYEQNVKGKEGDPYFAENKAAMEAAEKEKAATTDTTATKKAIQ